MNAKESNGFRRIETLATVMLSCHILFFACRAFDASRLGAMILLMTLVAGLILLFIAVKNSKKLIAESKSRFFSYLIVSLIYTGAVGLLLCEFTLF